MNFQSYFHLRWAFENSALIRKFLLVMIAACVCAGVVGEVRLPRLISDGMVLQRDIPLRLWGWASPGEKVSIKLSDEVAQAVADNTGRWKVTLKPKQAGGPYELKVSGTNTIIVHDVWVGDVWLCSGQSNMELPMRRVSWVYPEDIAQANYPRIRYFEVPKIYNFKAPQSDLPSGQWVSVTPQQVLSMSAVAYFFAREIHQHYGVPIGIINTSLGGSPIEAWLSEEALMAFPKYLNEGKRFRDSNLIQSIQQSDRLRIQQWYSTLQQKDSGYAQPGNAWYLNDIDTKGWNKMMIPQYWNPQPLGKTCGIVWFRRQIWLADSLSGKSALLILGRIVDADSVFVNGKFIGTTSYQYPPRRYAVPEGLLQAGKNTIVVKVIANSHTGGFVPDKPYELSIDHVKLDLKGEWLYRVGATTEPLQGQTFIQWKPMGLYNAMIAPLTNYGLKGVLWYQGESNVERAEEYESLLTTLINSWRISFNQPRLPFLYVQLPNFLEAKDEPSESKWALLREAQLKTLKIPYTGMAVTIDVGEWNDIHPLNKKAVGVRLAQVARRIAYGDTSTAGMGPIYQAMEIRGNKVILKFSCIDGGLTTCDGKPPRQFAIAGVGMKFVWAHAAIENNQVIVWHDTIAHPVAVRYAWADNPDGANLCNGEGLPASPFRTDSEK
ncbi:MAG: sialate O-acetylesterase [Bacteroidales bacterium]